MAKNCKYAVYFVSVCYHPGSKLLHPIYSAETWSWVEGGTQLCWGLQVTVLDDAECRSMSSAPGWGRLAQESFRHTDFSEAALHVSIYCFHCH